MGLKRVRHFESLVESGLESTTTRAWKFTLDANGFSAEGISPRDVTAAILPLDQSQLSRGLFFVSSTFGSFLYRNYDDDDCDVTTASAKRRDDVIKRLAVETAIAFCKGQFRDIPGTFPLDVL